VATSLSGGECARQTCRTESRQCTALCMGGEATPSVAAHYSGPLATVLVVLQAAFVLEITIRVVAYFPRPQDYFRKFWNSFDFIVVALALLPAIGGLGLISRLLRLARLVRIVSVSGALRSFTSGRTRGIAAVVSALLMVGLLWYVMALAGFYLLLHPQPATGSPWRAL
jgi:voltage-gated sodium channel